MKKDIFIILMVLMSTSKVLGLNHRWKNRFEQNKRIVTYSQNVDDFQFNAEAIQDENFKLTSQDVLQYRGEFTRKIFNKGSFRSEITGVQNSTTPTSFIAGQYPLLETNKTNFRFEVHSLHTNGEFRNGMRFPVEIRLNERTNLNFSMMMERGNYFNNAVVSKLFGNINFGRRIFSSLLLQLNFYLEKLDSAEENKSSNVYSSLQYQRTKNLKFNACSNTQFHSTDPKLRHTVEMIYIF